MHDEPPPPLDDADHAPDPAVPDLAVIDRLVAIDDRLAGHSGDDAAIDSGESRETAADKGSPAADITAALDTILLLRQVAAAEHPSRREPIMVPQRIGRYEVLREAGRGAFAYVLEAHDEILHRRVALKIARPESLVSAAFGRRFVREAELAARLIHAHIVAILEVGEDAGIVFIASEYCAGGDLAAWLDRHPGPVAPRQAAALVRDLASAVAHAHASSIVHRDIKPANVLLVPPASSPAGSDGSIGSLTAKLGDFGLGKLFDDPSAEDFTQLTRTGTRLGTPAWMAPEQIDRSFGEVGPSTDIHGLGLLLDRMLTGRCPFDGKTEAEIFRAVLLEEPRSADRVARNVPPDLAAVCLKCLAKRPADRYSSAADLAADLSRFLAGQPTQARPLSMASRLGRAISRRPLAVFLTLASVAGLLLATWAIGERRRETRRRLETQAAVGRMEAASELRRGFEAWRTGTAEAAIEHLRSCGTSDEGLVDSAAGRWLIERLHGEHDILVEPRPGQTRTDIYVFSFSADGRTVAVGAADGSLTIRGATTDAVGSERSPAEEPPRVIAAHDEVNDVAFSPDGSQVATAGEDGRLRIWNVSDGSLRRDADETGRPLFAAAYSPSGSLLAYGGAAQALWLAPAAGGAAQKLEPFAEAVANASVAVDADIESLVFIDERHLAAACGRMVGIIDLDGGGIRLFKAHYGTVGQIAVSRDGRRLVSGGTDREPQVWDIATGRLAVSLPRHPGWIQGCDFSPDGSLIATGCRDGVVRIFDSLSGAERTRMVGHVGRLWDVKFSPQGMVASAGGDGTLRRWDPAAQLDAAGMRDVLIPDSAEPRSADDNRRSAVAIATNGAGRRMAVLNLHRRAIMVDAATGRIDAFDAAALTASFNLAIDEARGLVASVSSAGPIELYRVPKGPVSPGEAAAALELGASLPGIRANDIAWTPAGMLLVSCDSGRLIAWNPETDRVVEVDQLKRTIDSLRLAPAGRPRLAITSGPVLRVYPLDASGLPVASAAKTLIQLRPLAEIVTRLAWSPDGGRLAYGTTAGEVRVIDASTGAAIATFPKHAREVVGIAWQPNGRTLVAADSECVRFSDVATTMTLDELRPGWRIEDLDSVGPRSGWDGPLVVIAGSAPVAAEAGRREVRVGIIDLRRTLANRREKP